MPRISKINQAKRLRDITESGERTSRIILKTIAAVGAGTAFYGSMSVIVWIITGPVSVEEKDLRTTTWQHEARKAFKESNEIMLGLMDNPFGLLPNPFRMLKPLLRLSDDALSNNIQLNPDGSPVKDANGSNVHTAAPFVVRLFTALLFPAIIKGFQTVITGLMR